jgi:nitrogen-specific signal transduction histidine kinase
VETRADFHTRGGTPNVLVIARDITEQVRAEEQMQQTQKMEAIGQLAGGIAHDFNNLLQAIHGYAQMASAQLTDGHAAGRPVDQILSAADRAAALTRQLLTFSRRQPVAADELDLNAVVTDVSNLLRRLLGERIVLRVETTSGLPRVTCDRSQMEQVVMNLCINARDAMKQGGRLTVTTGTTTFTAADCETRPWAREGSWVFLRVADEGAGIPADALPHIFEPFFTTKGVGEGTGLGLSTVYAVISRQGGLIDVDTREGGGTRITVYLPAPESVASAGIRRDSPALATLKGHETILLAEDDDLLRQLAQDTLAEAGYSVIAAEDGPQAEALAREHGSSLHAAVLDVVMPKRSGRKVADTIRVLRPDLPIVFMSGYTFGALDDMPSGGVSVLQKPFTRQALLKQVRDALDGVAR